MKFKGHSVVFDKKILMTITRKGPDGEPFEYEYVIRKNKVRDAQVNL